MAGSRVTDAMLDAGYGSSRQFYERAASKLAMPPQTYGRGGAGMEIGYAIVDSPLERLLVAATRKGVCAVYMGSSDAALERDTKGLKNPIQPSDDSLITGLRLYADDPPACQNGGARNALLLVSPGG